VTHHGEGPIEEGKANPPPSTPFIEVMHQKPTDHQSVGITCFGRFGDKIFLNCCKPLHYTDIEAL
jgi:hypothetical protein